MKQREKVGETAVAGPPQSKTIFLSKIKEDIKNSLLQEYSYIRNVDIVRTLWFPENLWQGILLAIQLKSRTVAITRPFEHPLGDALKDMAISSI